MCSAAKRARLADTLPGCLAKQLVAYMPHNTYLYLCRLNREPVCCARALFGACKQCDAVHTHAAMLWPCLRAVRSTGRSSFVLTVNSILDLHLHMQQDDDYEPVYSGSSIAEAHRVKAAWEHECANHW